MKVVTFTDGARTRLGLAKDDGLIDLRKAEVDLPRDMIALISGWAQDQSTVDHPAPRIHRRHGLAGGERGGDGDAGGRLEGAERAHPGQSELGGCAHGAISSPTTFPPRPLFDGALSDDQRH